MKKFRKSYIYLTGGLGNQLFQIAFLLTRNSTNPIAEISLGRPRVSANNVPDIFEFELDHVVGKVRFTNDFPITRRAINYMLKDGLKPKKLSKYSFVSKIARIITSLLISRALRQFIVAREATDNGFMQLPESNFSEYLIGYFQSYKWVKGHSHVFDTFKALKLREPSESFNRFISTKGDARVLVVHVRLGDYLLTPTIGVLSHRYYKNAFEAIFSQQEFETIWLFSNEPDSARNIIPNELKERCVVVNDASWTAAETLEAMRYGDGYIIANSSLSWWGAMLSSAVDPIVIAPTPWFKGQSDPIDLIPREWSLINGW